MIGHWIMDLDLTIMSLMGMLALTGVVVNSSLVLVDYINRQQSEEGLSVQEAIKVAGVARFRPVLLTSLTTFAGLTPIIFDKSTQAQFLIPMAVSLGYGVLFATFTTLLIIPVNYLILNDFSRAWYWLIHGTEPPTLNVKAPVVASDNLLGASSIGDSDSHLEAKRRGNLEEEEIEKSPLSRSQMSQHTIISLGDKESDLLNETTADNKSPAVSPLHAAALSKESLLGTEEGDTDEDKEELSPLSQPSISQSSMFVDLDAEPDEIDYEDTYKIVSVVEDNEPTDEEELSPLSQSTISQSTMFVDLDAEPDEEEYEAPQNILSMVEDETIDNEEELSPLSRSPMSQSMYFVDLDDEGDDPKTKNKETAEA